MPADDLTIVFDQAGTNAQFVRDHLDLRNVGVKGVTAYYPVHFFLKSERGETLRGLLASIWGGWLRISYLDRRGGARRALGYRAHGPGRSLCSRARLSFGRARHPFLPGPAVPRKAGLRGVEETVMLGMLSVWAAGEALARRGATRVR